MTNKNIFLTVCWMGNFHDEMPELFAQSSEPEADDKVLDNNPDRLGISGKC